MEININRICRLCLQICNSSFEVLDEIVQSNLNSLLLFPNLAVTDEPTICECCAENIKHCLSFKSKCVLSEDRIASLVCRENNMKIDLRELYRSEIEDKRTSDPSDSNVCRFCLEVVTCGTYMFLVNDGTQMLWKYFPELDFNATQQPVTCMVCHNSLKRYFDFITTCLQTEEKIMEYCRIEGTNSKGQIDLSDVLNFTSKNNLKNRDGPHMVKIEEIYLKSVVNGDTSCEVKAEISSGIMQTVDCKVKDEVEPKMESIECDSLLNDVTQHIFKCELCPYSATRKYDLKRHALSHKSLSEVAKYTCEKCDFQTEYKNYLRKHIRKDCLMAIHKSSFKATVMHKCTTCSFETKHKGCLYRHMFIHKSPDEAPMHKCHFCEHQTRIKADLRKHMVIHLSSSEVPMHKCTECSFETKHISSLHRHVLTHKSSSEATMTRCTQCDFTTKQKHYLLRHMLVHKSIDEIAMNKCHLCEYQTKFKYDLRKHMTIHKSSDEVTMHKCTKCNFETKHASCLRDHMVVHKNTSEVTMHGCGECNFKTKRKRNLKRHMLTHRSNSEVTSHKCT